MTSPARVTSAPNSTSSCRMTLRRRISSNRAALSSARPATWARPSIELEVLAEVARHVVGQLEDADHLVARHERRRELGLVAPLLERRPAGRREHRVVEAGGQRDAALSDGDGAARVVAQPDGGALPRAVEGPVVVAHQRAQRLAFDRIDVGDRRVREARQAAGDALEDVVGRQVRGVFDAGFDERAGGRGCGPRGRRSWPRRSSVPRRGRRGGPPRRPRRRAAAPRCRPGDSGGDRRRCGSRRPCRRRSSGAAC